MRSGVAIIRHPLLHRDAQLPLRHVQLSQQALYFLQISSECE
jgi:hypothetical protein